MITSRKFVFALALAFFCALGVSTAIVAQDARLQPADTILINGKVYTVNNKQGWAHAVAMRGEKILAVGDDSDIEKLRRPGTKIIDAEGKLVLPGFVDCHIHFLEGSISLGQANLEGAKNPSDIQRVLREYA
jgi:predicted amidohydrolase YtcJ